MSVYCFHVDSLGRRRALLTLCGNQGANSVNDITRPGINEPVRHNFDNHDVNYDFVNGRGPM